MSDIVLFTVGEEDEVSIKEAAEAVVCGMKFTGETVVSLSTVYAVYSAVKIYKAKKCLLVLKILAWIISISVAVLHIY